MQKLYQGLGHIAIHTRDMDGSIAFYEKIGGSLHLRAPACSPEQQRELALVEFGGFLVELIAAPVPEGAGCIPHFAVYVDDVDQAAADLRAAGVDTFQTAEKCVMPNTFGGLENWFFTVIRIWNGSSLPGFLPGRHRRQAERMRQSYRLFKVRLAGKCSGNWNRTCLCRKNRWQPATKWQTGHRLNFFRMG